MNTRLTKVSVWLNVLLTAALVWALNARRPPTATPTTPSAPAEPTTVTPASSSAPVPAPSPLTQPTNNFHWSALESADYLAYVSNLRAIGCPEETIRDIIVADVNKVFAPRYAALSESTPELAWWGRFDKKRPVRPELARQLQLLNDEKKAVLLRLLGPDVSADLPAAEVTVNEVRTDNLYAFLPTSKRSPVRDIVERYRALREWSEVQWKGLPTDERDAREKELRDNQARELATLLSPEQLQEFELRDSFTSDRLREEYGQANLSEAEFRRLFDLRRRFEETNPEPSRDDWKQLEADYGAALGPERLTDLKQQNDAMWVAMQDLAAKDALPPDAIQEAFALKQDYSEKLVQAVGQMFADPMRDPTPLHDLAAEMEARLEVTLGTSAAQQLIRLGVLPRLVVQDDGKEKMYTLVPGGFSN